MYPLNPNPTKNLMNLYIMCLYVHFFSFSKPRHANIHFRYFGKWRILKSIIFVHKRIWCLLIYQCLICKVTIENCSSFLTYSALDV